MRNSINGWKLAKGKFQDCQRGYLQLLHSTVRQKTVSAYWVSSKRVWPAGQNRVIISLHTALAKLYVEYQTQCWATPYKTGADNLENVQWRASRVVRGMEHMPWQEDEGTLKLNLSWPKGQTWWLLEVSSRLNFTVILWFAESDSNLRVSWALQKI